MMAGRKDVCVCVCVCAKELLWFRKGYTFESMLKLVSIRPKKGRTAYTLRRRRIASSSTIFLVGQQTRREITTTRKRTGVHKVIRSIGKKGSFLHVTSDKKEKERDSSSGENMFEKSSSSNSVVVVRRTIRYTCRYYPPKKMGKRALLFFPHWNT